MLREFELNELEVGSILVNKSTKELYSFVDFYGSEDNKYVNLIKINNKNVLKAMKVSILQDEYLLDAEDYGEIEMSPELEKQFDRMKPTDKWLE